MMIKLRAWDKECKVMRDYDELKGLTLDALDTDNFEIEQLTGLKDVNGKDIYDGDIVKSNYKYAQPKISQIIMADGNSYIAGEDLATGNEMLVSDHVEEIEVIGNVHENPELLEEEK
ncbi:YopX family protein [Companilactobacillus crustorum]|uniref:YopX family protein n=1 Tax=Companilactobacillus crustorum TaxID=392416 RepID=UPI00237D9F26|nr:YopX family protein [Companilactobacillus crustorum]WDT65138.1 YopX family protein [Companilactobacillus crustorum]